MKYELAKELKDAGFTQVENPFALVYDKDFDLSGEQAHDSELRMRVGAYPPTLSELIEAVEPNFISLAKHAPERGSMKGRYIASGWPFLMDVHTKKQMWIGKTPEEAVSLLWLALNPVENLKTPQE